MRRYELMGPIGSGRWMLVAVLFLGCGSLPAGEKNEARKLFDRMEKKLAAADTIQLTVQGKLKGGDEEGTVKATLLLGQGNKARLDVSIQKSGGKTHKVSMVSNGTKQKSGSPGELKEKDTPKHLRDNLVYHLSLIGFTPALMHTKPADQSKPQKGNMLVSDFRLGKRDKIGGKEVHVLHYKFAFAAEKKKFATTLYLDVKTLLPVVRTIPAYGNLREEYQYRLNEKIGKERFDLPK